MSNRKKSLKEKLIKMAQSDKRSDRKKYNKTVTHLERQLKENR